MIPTELIIAAGCLASGTIGFLAASILCATKARKAEFRAWREAERLFRQRALQDCRDQTSARL